MNDKEKAKAYDEIIERAKTMLSAGEVMYGKENNASQLITDLIPELAESEDEKMGDIILEGFKNYSRSFSDWNDVPVDRIIAYLERQKEQKPADYCSVRDEFDLDGNLKQKSAEKQDYSGLTDFERAIHRGFLCAGVENVSRTIIEETAQECMSKMRPAEWRRFLWHPMMRFDYTSIVKYDGSEDYEIVKAGNKPSKEQNGVFIPIKEISTKPHWKPSKTQIEELEYASRIMQSRHLTSLYQDLLKLK